VPEKEVLLTIEGLKKLEDEQEQLKAQKLKVADRLKQAIEFGDISENSEYDDAKNEQAFIESRIITLEKMLANAKVIENSDDNKDLVTLGCRVVLRDLEMKEQVEYLIVGSAEADPGNQRISNESPVGRAVLGRAKGDKVKVAAPLGTLTYQVVDIL
jgi:transcription elongation factor GreA